jgi:hypothetical protein
MRLCIGCSIVVFQFDVTVFKVDSEIPRLLAAFLLTRFLSASVTRQDLQFST